MHDVKISLSAISHKKDRKSLLALTDNTAYVVSDNKCLIILFIFFCRYTFFMGSNVCRHLLLSSLHSKLCCCLQHLNEARECKGSLSLFSISLHHALHFSLVLSTQDDAQGEWAASYWHTWTYSNVPQSNSDQDGWDAHFSLSFSPSDEHITV